MIVRCAFTNRKIPRESIGFLRARLCARRIDPNAQMLWESPYTRDRAIMLQTIYLPMREEVRYMLVYWTL